MAARRRTGRRRSAPRHRRRPWSMPTARAPLRSRTPRRSSSSSRAAATSESFWGSTCWRDTIRVTSLPSELNMWTNSTPGDARADDDEVLGPDRRRVGVARGQHPLAVDLGPVGDPRPAAGGQEDDVGLELHGPSAVSATTWWGPASRPRPRMMRTPWLSSSCRVPCSSLRSMASMRARRASGSTVACGRGEAHLRATGRRRPGHRRWRSWPWTGCSPRGGRRRR